MPLERRFLLPLVVAAAAAAAACVIPAAHAASVFALPADNLSQSFYLNTVTGTILPGFPLTEEYEPCATVAVNNDGMPRQGWDAVVVTVPDTLADSANITTVRSGYYCAGFAEGYTTAQRVLQTYRNMQIEANWNNASQHTQAWIANHTKWMRDQVAEKGGGEANGGASTAGQRYWQQVGHYLAQMDGLAAGATAWFAGQELPGGGTTNNNVSFAFIDIFLINFVFEFFDVEAAMDALYPEFPNRGVPPSPAELRKMVRPYGSHCSALVRVVPETQELLVAHNTWTSLESMLRQYKVYQFGKAFSVAFSSYPATIHSGDDFYILGDEFVVQETTNENMDPASTATLVEPLAVSEFLRLLVANRLAQNGSNWAALFCEHNTGTYNNQWMVVDMANYALHGNQVANDTLWITEQMPGACVSGDQSAVLRSQSYWSSYNRPFYPEVYRGLGFLALEEQFGTYYSYNKNYRAEIFARNATGVDGIVSLMSLMRYNDYLHDPFSLIPNCTGAGPTNTCDPPYSPYLSIANRNDLVPANASIGVLGPEIGLYNQAAVDAKLISSSMVNLGANISAWIISSPTYGGASAIPPFQWSTSPFNATPHDGIPDLMNFTWILGNEAFNGAVAPAPNAFLVNETIYFSVQYRTENYSASNFAWSLFSVMQAVYSAQQCAVPFSVDAVVDLVSVASVTHVTAPDGDVDGGDTYLVLFEFFNNSDNVFRSSDGRENAVSLSALLRLSSLATNLLLWATPAQLFSAGLSSLAYTTTSATSPATPGSGLNKYIIVGVVVAGVVAVVVIVVVVRRCRKKCCGDDGGHYASVSSAGDSYNSQSGTAETARGPKRHDNPDGEYVPMNKAVAQ